MMTHKANIHICAPDRERLQRQTERERVRSYRLHSIFFSLPPIILVLYRKMESAAVSKTTKGLPNRVH